MNYRRRFKPDHPNANTQGQVYEHRLVAEEKLGRYLLPNEIVHHIDGNKLNNNPDNLDILDKLEHQRVHAEHRALMACGNSKYMRCPYCKEYDDPSNMYVRKAQYQAWHHACAAEYKAVKEPKTGPYKNNPRSFKLKLKQEA